MSSVTKTAKLPSTSQLNQFNISFQSMQKVIESTEVDLMAGVVSAKAGDKADEFHTHQYKAQIALPMLGSSGLVVQNKGKYFSTLDRGVYIPAKLVHTAIDYSHSAEIFVIYLNQDLITQPSLSENEVVVFRANALVRALMLKLASWGVVRKLSKEGDFYSYVKTLLTEMAENSNPELFLPMSNDPRLKKAISYIEKNELEDLSLEVLSQKCAVSSRQLTRLFQSELGMKYKDYLDHYRFIRAVQVYAENRSLTYVAYELGFSDGSSFNRFFKRFTQMTPSEYFERI